MKLRWSRARKPSLTESTWGLTLITFLSPKNLPRISIASIKLSLVWRTSILTSVPIKDDCNRCFWIFCQTHSNLQSAVAQSRSMWSISKSGRTSPSRRSSTSWKRTRVQPYYFSTACLRCRWSTLASASRKRISSNYSNCLASSIRRRSSTQRESAWVSIFQSR